MQKINEPVYCNTPAGHTSETGLNACLDWLEGTLKKVDDIQQIFALFGLKNTDFLELGYGQFDFKNCLSLPDKTIKFYYNNIEHDNYVRFVCTGQGMRYIEEHSVYDWLTIFTMLNYPDFELKMSRIDLAIDDFKGYFTPNTLFKKCSQKAVVSKLKYGRYIKSFKLDDFDDLGETMYFGSPQSEFLIRVYDKIKERQFRKFIVHKDVKVWTRTELQLRGRKADLLNVLIFEREPENIGNFAFDILKTYIDFKVPSKSDINKSRWKSCKWWSDYLGDVQGLSLSLRIKEPTLERSLNWALNSWGKTLVGLRAVFKNDNVFFDTLESYAMDKMNEHDWYKIEEFKKIYDENSVTEFLANKFNDKIINDTSIIKLKKKKEKKQTNGNDLFSKNE